MQVSTTSGTSGITYNYVTVKAPAGKGCRVFEDTVNKNAEAEHGDEGVVKTKPLKGHTTLVREKVGVEEREVHSFIVEPVTTLF